MIVTSPAGIGTVGATFRLQPVVGCHEICLVGEFNDWSLTANPMTFNDDGYTAENIVATGRTYRLRSSSTTNVGRTTGQRTIMHRTSSAVMTR